MTKKQIGDYLKVKKNAPDVAPSNNRMDANIVNDPNIDPTMYEDITLEDLYKFEKLMELYDTQNNSRSKKYIRM